MPRFDLRAFERSFARLTPRQLNRVIGLAQTARGRSEAVAMLDSRSESLTCPGCGGPSGIAGARPGQVCADGGARLA